MLTDNENFLDEQIAGLSAVLAILMDTMNDAGILNSGAIEEQVRGVMAGMAPQNAAHGTWRIFNNFLSVLEFPPDPENPVERRAKWLRGVIRGGRT